MRHDAVVVGLGPAGRAVTHRLVARGLAVLAIDPHPDRPWRHTLSGWHSQLPGWLPAEAVGARSRDPLIRTGTDRPVRAEYVVLDNDAVRRALDIRGAEVAERTVDDDALGRLRRLAPVILDARGARPAGHSRAVPEQTAYGLAAEPARVAALFGGAEAVLMDWRHYDGGARWGAEPASFLYAIPLPDGRALVEETCLAGSPGIGARELRRRLLIRAERAGVPANALDGAGVERVRIPLLRTGRSRRAIHRFGAGGAESNPFTGYSAFAALAAADDLARTLSLGVRRSRLPADEPGMLRRRALRALLQLTPDDTVALFDAFARLPVTHQLTVLDAHSGRAALLAGLGGQWWRLPPSGRRALVRATVGPRSRPTQAEHQPGDDDTRDGAGDDLRH